MKLKSMISFILPILIVTSCADNNTGNEAQSANAAKAENKVTANIADGQQGGIVGEWDQQYTCYDTNGDAKLDQGERTPAKQMLGFNYFKFNADGSCLRDKDVKFEGKYEIKETKSGKDLVINSPDGASTGVKYSINGEITNELVLYNSGVFLVFKRK